MNFAPPCSEVSESSRCRVEGDLGGVWITDDDGTEEKREVQALKKITQKHDVELKVWDDEKYYIDE